MTTASPWIKAIIHQSVLCFGAKVCWKVTSNYRHDMSTHFCSSIPCTIQRPLFGLAAWLVLSSRRMRPSHFCSAGGYHRRRRSFPPSPPSLLPRIVDLITISANAATVAVQSRVSEFVSVVPRSFRVLPSHI